MLKLLKWTGIVLVSLVVLFFVVGLFLPREVEIERSVVVDAPPEVIHVLVDDLERWPEWEPWTEMDPTVKTTSTEPTRGVGAHQVWEDATGGGELTVTLSDPARGIEYDMQFNDGEQRYVGYVTYEPTAGGTRVTWGMKGDAGGVVGRYFGLLMDGFVGPPFERGLAKLKVAAERLATTRPAEESDAG